MGKNETARTWVAVIVIIVATSIFAVLWSGLSGSFSAPSTSIETESVHVTIPLPNGDELSLTSIQLFLGLGAIVIGLVVVTGIVIGFVNLFLSRQVHTVTTSEEFQQHQSALAAKEKEALAQKQEGRKSAAEQQHDYKQWSAWSTALAILMFVAFSALMVSSALIPTGEIIRDGQLFSATAVVVGISSLITLIFLVWRIRPQKIEAIDQTDNDKAPWDVVWVILSGLLIVGLGTGLMIYLIGQA